MTTIMSLSLRCAARSNRSRTIISQTSQAVLIELDLNNLCPFVTPVMPKLGGEGGGDKPPRFDHRQPRLDPLDPRTPSSEISLALPVANALLAHVLHLAF
jgi:hypothetical protein